MSNYPDSTPTSVRCLLRSLHLESICCLLKSDRQFNRHFKSLHLKDIYLTSDRKRPNADEQTL